MSFKEPKTAGAWIILSKRDNEPMPKERPFTIVGGELRVKEETGQKLKILHLKAADDVIYNCCVFDRDVAEICNVNNNPQEWAGMIVDIQEKGNRYHLVPVQKVQEERID